MRLWDWARRAYAAPGAQVACVALQDGHGQSVCYLLWAAWAAAEGRGTASALGRAAEIARAWESVALEPLRAARTGLKAQASGIDPAARMALRGRIAEDELTAERLLLVALEELVGPSEGAARPLGLALDQAVAAWGAQAPTETLETLSRIFADLGSC